MNIILTILLLAGVIGWIWSTAYFAGWKAGVDEAFEEIHKMLNQIQEEYEARNNSENPQM